MGPVNAINEKLKIIQSLHPEMPLVIQKAIAFGKTLKFDSINKDQVNFYGEVEKNVFVSATMIVREEKNQALLVDQSKTLSMQNFKEFATFSLSYPDSNTVVGYNLETNSQIIY